MLSRIAYRINAVLERYLPEQRLFLKSDYETRFIRLRPMSQFLFLLIVAMLMAWTIVASSVMFMETLGSSSAREQTQRQQQVYEERLNNLSNDRDRRANEAASAQKRFTAALTQVAAMQKRLLASEDRRRELETGIEVIQTTLRRTIKERDAARAELAAVAGGAQARDNRDKVADLSATVDILTDALDGTAQERDSRAADALRAETMVSEVEDAKRALERRNDMIFAKLEEALTVSVEPLDKMFRNAGLSPEELLDAVRAGYSGQGGPLSPIRLSTSGAAPTPEEQRANAISSGLDKMNMYRIAAFKAPFTLPVNTAVRYTSGFGGRNDPLGRGYRKHEGQDLAGAYGAPILSSADGVVTFAGWQSGYGRLVKIRHAFGIETRYGHLAQIRVSVGDRVSRGDRIGDMGNSGRSTGTHLHYEIRVNGRAIDPMTFIKAARDVF